MEVLVGPTTYTMEMDVSSSSAAAAFVRDRTGTGVVVLPASAQDDNNNNRKVGPTTSCLFLKEEETGSDDSSESSSSIGAPGHTDDDDDSGEENGEVSSSKLSLDSLEDSLPIKRGLSSHFSGKSKSFANLSDMSSSTCTVKDLGKPENPFNKRRRVLIANKWARKSSFYSWQNPKSMPLLTVHEDQDHADHQLHNPVAEEEEEEEEKNQTRVCGNRLKKKIGFKSQSCFSLADLHEEEYQ